MRHWFALGNSLLGAVNLTTNTDPDKYKYPGSIIGFVAKVFCCLIVVVNL